MIYLSKLRERYLAALRLHIQRGILRGRNTEKLLLQLKKIMLCEAMSSEGENSPLDILKYADSLLGAAIIILLQRGKRLSVGLSGGGVFLINRKALTALLLLSADNCTEDGSILISADKNTVTIHLAGIVLYNTQKLLIRRLGGTFYKVVCEDKAIITFPAEETDEKPTALQNEWELLSDKFSAVNIFLMRNSEFKD